MKPQQIRETLEVFYSFRKFRFMSYPDYLNAIVRLYEEKTVNGEISPRLLNPTPAKIKNECLLVYQSRFVKKDLKILLDFLEVNEGADVLRLIKNGRDRFKPLDNFLRDGTEKPEDRHIELLGWLLNFEPRPFVPGYNYATDKLDVSTDIPETDIGIHNDSELLVGEAVPDPIPENSGSDESDKSKQIPEEPPLAEPFPIELKPDSPIRTGLAKIYGWFDRRIITARVGGVAVLGLITAIYFINKGPVFGAGNPDTSGCMIWTGNNYQQIPCDSTVRKGIVVPLDIKRMASLRRITTPDTLRIEDIENVWYKKRDRHIEYYTDGGKDPVNPNVDLHPLTEYMFNKYLGGEHLSGSVKTE